MSAPVLRLADIGVDAAARLLGRFGLQLCEVGPNTAIDGSYWGDCEAGVIGLTVVVRADTPVHSLLHEACHVICMPAARRAALDTDAGGDDLEECAVCYLQILLADELPGVGRDRLLADMDTWGYSFRLGTAAAWLRRDAGDALEFLRRYGLVDNEQRPTFRLRR